MRKEAVKRVSINLKAVGAYLFVLILVYLAGVYVGRFYYFLYVFMFVLPLYSIAQVLLSVATLDAIQAIEGENSSKGDTLHYRVWITGKPLLTTNIILRFKPVHSRLPIRIPEMRVALTGRRLVEESFDINLKHRGNYDIGIESIEITDPLGWLSLRKVGSYQSFFVHPRVLSLSPPVSETRVHAQSESGTNGVEQDLTLFEGLIDYREGDPIKYIAWKKYLTTGAPYLKQFGGSSEPAVTIYLDLRQAPGLPLNDERQLSAEDCSIEIAICLVQGYLARGIRVRVRGVAERLYEFSGSSPTDFARFFNESDGLCFAPYAPSPVQLYESDRSEGAIEGTILFITHIVDERIFETAAERGLVGERTGVFFNLTSSNEVERDRAASYGRTVHSTGAGVYYSAEERTLVDDLQRWEVIRR